MTSMTAVWSVTSSAPPISVPSAPTAVPTRSMCVSARSSCVGSSAICDNSVDFVSAYTLRETRTRNANG